MVLTVDVKPNAKARRLQNHVETVDIAGYSIILAPTAEPVLTSWVSPIYWVTCVKDVDVRDLQTP